MRLLSRCRTAAARHPLVYWSAVALLGLTAGGSMWHERARVATARASWGTTRLVAVAAADLAPGDRPTVHAEELPIAMVPAAAVAPDEVHGDLVVVQHVGAGEVLTSFDLGSDTLTLLPPGWVALAARVEPPPPVAIGDHVQLLGNDATLADDAVVVDVADDVITFGVPADTALAVAEAGRLQQLAVGLLRPG